MAARFLISAVDGGESLESRLGRFTSEKEPWPHIKVGWAPETV